MSGQLTDKQGYALMVGDSLAASQQFGFDGIGLRNVPKSKFMFYVKFHRARSQGGSAWEKGLGFAVKSLDRPRIAFKLETLNQYNRKRIIQTQSEFEVMNLKLHDTVREDAQRMFEEYYKYYYYEQDAYSNTTVNDIVKQRMDPANPFGLKPGKHGDGFFSHITVYQIFNKQVSTFDLFNPKIEMFNPDELDYAQHASATEIVMSVAFEGITYRGIEALTPAMAQEMGIDHSGFYDVTDVHAPPLTNFGSGGVSGEKPSVDLFGPLSTGLASSITTGTGAPDVLFRSLSSDALNSFDKTNGVATAQLGVDGIGNLLKGVTGISDDPFAGLDLFGGPTSDF